MNTETVGSRKADRLQPKLSNITTMLDVDMRRFQSFKAIEKEAEAMNP